MISGTRMYSFSGTGWDCDKHGHTCTPTGFGECNTPKGHDQVYEMYRCTVPGCQSMYGIPTGIHFYHETPETIVFLDLHGDTLVRTFWFDLRRWLDWDGDKWVMRDEPTYEGSMK